jgi:hypothetical protein
MHYGAESPVFNAFELTIRKLTNGAVAPNGVNAEFCSGCHAPTSKGRGELPDYVSESTARPLTESFSEVSRDGVSCDMCHTVKGPDLAGSLLGDGVANLALRFSPSEQKRGPIEAPQLSESAHPAVGDPYFSSSAFCGSCHDVRVPRPDLVTGEPFQRLENLFTEWQEGPYATANNPHGTPVSCQDCHMSLYPLAPPGTYAQAPAADVEGAPVRKHTNHAFTAVSMPLVDDPRFPHTDSQETDAWGFPLGQEARREQMLRAACTLTLEGTPAEVQEDAAVLPIKVVVTNVGAGHRVPAGFSQERQVWVELVVQDDAGLIYASGTLHDKAHPETGELAPDGRLHDEDLEDRHYDIDLATFETHYRRGPDYDQRPEGVNLGLMNFQNEFIRLRPDGSWEPVLNPLLADHMKNTNSLDMLVPKVVPYDVPLTRPPVGKVRVEARLRFRAFPPEFLRFLAQREPDLVTEATVDRNTIVDMASAARTVKVVPSSP